MKDGECFVELRYAHKNVHVHIFMGVAIEVIIKRRIACNHQTGSVMV